MGLTLKQISDFLQVINKSAHEELMVEAKLHGMKVKPIIDGLEMSNEEREQCDKQAQSSYERLKLRYQMKKLGLKNG